MTAQPQRPPIIGVSHIALKTANLEASRAFYVHDLGLAAGKLTSFKVNDHQFVEISPSLKSDTEDRLSHIAFETTDVRRLREYLVSRGVQVLPGVHGLMVKDPDGHEVEFVQHSPASPGAGLRMIHVGITVADRDAADRLYKDILGFDEMWHGGRTDDRIDWVDMRVPNGSDWLEYMLNVRNPSPRTLGVMHHFALGVQSVKTAYEELLARGVKPREEPKIGRDGKWQLNLYDPDLARAELMEFKPVQTPCCSPIKLLQSDR